MRGSDLQVEQQEQIVGEIEKILTREELKQLLKDVGAFLVCLARLCLVGLPVGLAAKGYNRPRPLPLARHGAQLAAVHLCVLTSAAEGKRLEEVAHNGRDLRQRSALMVLFPCVHCTISLHTRIRSCAASWMTLQDP